VSILPTAFILHVYTGGRPPASVRVRCPYCMGTHNHAIGSLNFPRLGSRRADCIDGGDYELGPLPEKAR
jgi:hypothetical protein